MIATKKQIDPNKSQQEGKRESNNIIDFVIKHQALSAYKAFVKTPRNIL